MPRQYFNRAALLASISAISVSLLGGCSVERAHTVPFDGSDMKGVVYSVPKTYLSMKLKYEFVHDDVRPGPSVGHLASQIDSAGVGALQMSPVLIPDSKSTYLIKTNKLVNNIMFLSSISFRFNNGTLESVDATSSDRTGQILEELGTTAVNIAKAAAKGGEASPHDQAVHAAEVRLDQIYAAIAKFSTDPIDPKQSPKELENLQIELNKTRALIKDLRANADPPVRTETAVWPVMLDPDAPTRKTADYLEYEIHPPQLFEEVPADNMDVAFVRIYDDHRRNLITSLEGPERPKDVGGVLYRQPVRLLTTVLVGGGGDEATEIFTAMVPYVQFAPAAIAELDSKVLTSKHTTLVLDTVNGGLVSYGIIQDAAPESVVKAGEAISADAAAPDKSNSNQNGRGSYSSGGRGGGSNGGSSGGKPGGGSGGGNNSGSSGGNGSGSGSPRPKAAAQDSAPETGTHSAPTP